MKEEWKAIALDYSDKDWPFSSAYAWLQEVNQNPTPFNLTQYANELRLSGNMEEAMNVMSKVEIDKMPEEYKFVYHVRIGTIYADQSQISESVKSFRNAVRLNPKVTYPYIFLATELSKLNQLDEVEQTLLQALTKNGDIDEVNFNLSTNYARKGNFVDAIKFMKACLEIDPNYENAREWLGDFENMNSDLLKEVISNK